MLKIQAPCLLSKFGQLTNQELASDPNADFGGLIYIWDGKTISDNASTASPEIIDLAIAASEAGVTLPKNLTWY